MFKFVNNLFEQPTTVASACFQTESEPENSIWKHCNVLLVQS